MSLTDKQIKAKLDKINTKIGTLLIERENVKANICSHNKVEMTACSNSGNYDPHADSYWYEFHCQVCEKFWTEDQTQYLDRQRKEKFAWEKAREIVKKSRP